MALMNSVESNSCDDRYVVRKYLADSVGFEMVDGGHAEYRECIPQTAIVRFNPLETKQPFSRCAWIPRLYDVVALRTGIDPTVTD